MMRIHIRISMTGKMLAYGKYTTIFQSTCISYHFIRHIYRTFSKRAGIDNGILRIDIHIRHRSKVDLHANITALPGHLAPVLIEQAVVLYTAQNHISRKHRCTPQTHGKSPLTVEGNHQRNICHFLRFISQCHLIFH